MGYDVSLRNRTFPIIVTNLSWSISIPKPALGGNVPHFSTDLTVVVTSSIPSIIPIIISYVIISIAFVFVVGVMMVWIKVTSVS